ncbi:efflux RND transporter periplasmic adaptor subunit [Vibrio salinus]|uniref:efflux RND transporter periplasmic adaptor subunit n=1 Tax=Vibrio salinus TaxID=2899784 RepID=UPI001E43252A|nr:biotin/lipoyl-binding protein [Vibrio salinus]MCE0495921.1 biotin/lipoyl-binding protein [Vibrio salinus]
MDSERAISRGNPVESALMSLLLLEKKARNASNLPQLQFIMLNQTRTLVDYDHLILWDPLQNRITGASGVPEVDVHAPLIQWLNKHCSTIAKTTRKNDIHRLATHEWLPFDRSMFAEHLSEVLIWFPVKGTDGELVCVLLLSRSEPLSIREERLLDLLGDSYGHTWIALRNSQKPKRLSLPGRKKFWVSAVVLCIALMFVPVRQSVLAPSEIISSSSVVVRMPINGVVQRLNVRPNHFVKKGQLLMTLDARQLNDQLAQARQRLAISSAELRLARQQSFYDGSRKASISILEGREKLAKSQVSYLQKKLKRTSIYSPQDGISLFDDQGDWIGRPLNFGEPIMFVADPKKTQLEIQLAVENMMELKPGDEIRFFPNSNPTEAILAEVKTIAYHSTLQNDGQYAYVLKGMFVENNHIHQMGLKGTAKLYGKKTTLFYYLFRRPISHLRLWWGAL